MTNTQKIPDEAGLVLDGLQSAGYEAYFVGGCVRDLLRGVSPKDWDVTTDATPEQIQEIFEHTFCENAFGTVGVVNDETDNTTLKTVEVTTYRLEAGYSDARHPDSVKFSSKLEDDLKRRDFTVNALALNLPVDERDLAKGETVDLYEGKKDLVKGQIRAVGNPDDRFGEDALRMLRAVRLATELDFEIEKETAEAIRNTAQQLDKIASERIRDEFMKIIMSEKPRRGLELAKEVGVLPHLLPELLIGDGVEQNQAHSYTVFEHCVRTLQAAADKKWGLELRLAALLHDIAKPKTRAWDDKKQDWSFHNHQVVGARMSKEILRRLRFPGEVVDKVWKLVRNHMFFSDTDVITHSAVRRMMRNVGQENVQDIINLRVADRVGTGRPKEQPYRLRKYQAMIEEVMRDPVSVGMLKIDGGRIMKISGEKPGPRLGWTLHALLEDVLDDPNKNTEEYLETRTMELLELSDDDLKKLGREGIQKKEEVEGEEVKKIRSQFHVE